MRERLDALTGLRALAALAVVLFHLNEAVFPTLGLPGYVPAMACFYLGVDLFFILSGFVLMHVHSEDFRTLAPSAIGRFLGLRLARIYPVHLAMMLGFLVLVVGVAHLPAGVPIAIDSGGRYSVGGFFRHIFLVEWFHLSWNFPAWSVGAEWTAYLAFPLLTLLFRRMIRAGWCSVLLLGILALYAAVYALVLGYSLDELCLWRVCFEFPAGCVLYRLSQSAAVAARRWVPLAVFGAAAAGAVLAFDTAWRDLAVVVLLWSIVWVCGDSRGNAVSHCLEARPLVWLGEVSYSVYMVQALVQGTAGRVFAALQPHLPMPARYALVPLAVGCVVIAGAAVHAWIERPARDVLRRRLLAPRRAAPIALEPAE
ncbi:MAG TPA: acyltransferase [Stellaceae bacterium]